MPTAPITIRPARDEEMRACRGLMPEAFSTTQAPICHVALAEDQLVGAACVAWVPGGFPVDVHVVPAWRRRGVGRALIDDAAASAAGETGALRSWRMIAEGSPAESFLRATGFVLARRFHGFEANDDFLVPLSAARRRFERIGAVPPSARVVGLAEAPKPALVRLIAAELKTMPTTVAARIAAQDVRGYDGDLSVVLMVDGHVGGAMLAMRDGDVARVEAQVVAPALRRGWATVVLLDELTRRASAAQVKRYRFFGEETNRDTMNLGKRTGAPPLGVSLVFERALRADPSRRS
ncbi:MAG: GNAT family N-acetyltransferase [Alphaproteobacteria bacterium]